MVTTRSQAAAADGSAANRTTTTTTTKSSNTSARYGITNKQKTKPGGGRSRATNVWLLSILVIPLLAVAIPALYLSVTYGPPPANFGSGSMFDRIATRYDFINRALALNMDTAWRVEMVKAVTSNGDLFTREKESSNASTSKILDLATGTADVAILLANAAREASAAATASRTQVLGVDPSQNMISVGRDKIRERNLEEIVTLDIGDARNLVGLRTNDFDAATMSFGIRNVPEKEKALCEIWRVMKKDGRSKLGILEFSEPGPDTGFLGSVARLFIRHIVPVMGAALSGAPKEYLHLQNSIQEFPSPEKFKALMEGINCATSIESTAVSDDGEETKTVERQTGAFRVEEVRQMNFGSVQLYLATPYKS